MLNEQREEAHVDRARNVHLTNLRRFSLHEVDPASDSDGIASLLSKLVLPPQAVVLLNSTGDSEANGHWIPETLSRSDFDFTRPTRMQLRFYRRQLSHRTLGQLKLSVIAASQHGGVIVTKELLAPAGRFASNFHLAQLQYLLYLEAPSHIDDDGLWQSWMWSSILPEVPALERLTIFGRSLPDIARALNRDGPMRVQPHLCPQLSQIVVLLSSDDPPVDRTMATRRNKGTAAFFPRHDWVSPGSYV